MTTIFDTYLGIEQGKSQGGKKALQEPLSYIPWYTKSLTSAAKGFCLQGLTHNDRIPKLEVFLCLLKLRTQCELSTRRDFVRQCALEHEIAVKGRLHCGMLELVLRTDAHGRVPLLIYSEISTQCDAIGIHSSHVHRPKEAHLPDKSSAGKGERTVVSA